MQQEVAVDSRHAADVGRVTDRAANLAEDDLAALDLCLPARVVRHDLDRPGQGVAEPHERAELLRVQIGFHLGVRRVRQGLA